MCLIRPIVQIGFVVAWIGTVAVNAQTKSGPTRESRSPVKNLVSGPRGPMNQALALGATATMTLQPVAPKTVPASNYPPGTTITGSTIRLGSVPARVWLEVQVTNWAPDELVSVQLRADGTDQDGDGGGYSGAYATCGGAAVVGAGDITPAYQPCGGTCPNGRTCIGNFDCQSCVGGSNAGDVCGGPSDCPGGTCTAGGACNGNPGTIANNAVCRQSMSGRTSTCSGGEPSVCISASDYFPQGAGSHCAWGFIDQCDPEFLASGLGNMSAVDLSTSNFRAGTTMNDPTGANAIDHAPSYSSTVVLDVPADAKGTYTIDINQIESFMVNTNPSPNNMIPIASLNPAIILVVDCDTNADCQDNNACTADVCQGGCCTNFSVAGFDPETECCNPANGSQAPRPLTAGCRVGICTQGGSYGLPSFAFLPDGSACNEDPCYYVGECSSGQCVAEQHAGSNCPKPRFISFDIGTDTAPKAYRVRMVSLHHPDPPYTGGTAADFSAFEGEYRWVGSPSTYVESSANSTPVYAAFTTCNPHYRDWSPFDLMHVSGAEIVPSSLYEVQSIAQGLDINNEANYSEPISIPTSRWADVSIPFAPPITTTQPDQNDHTAVVVKFRSFAGAMSKPRALLAGAGAGGIPSLNLDISFTEIATIIDAYAGRPYPYAGPQPCP